jgi:ABC-type Fe3+/spermidine/putrescine transport system ATPase subunit
LGAANVLKGVLRNDYVEIGAVQIPAQIDSQRFQEGQTAKLIFRPEDVSFSKNEMLPEGHCRLGTGVIEEMNFVGAYERLNVRLDPSMVSVEDGQASIMATRVKPGPNALKLKTGDAVTIGMASFTVLPTG